MPNHTQNYWVSQVQIVSKFFCVLRKVHGAFFELAKIIDSSHQFHKFSLILINKISRISEIVFLMIRANS
jgi:hypothetical protein